VPYKEAGAGDAAAYLRKFLRGKIWVKYWQNWQIWEKVIKIRAIFIRFGQNQNFASPKH